MVYMQDQFFPMLAMWAEISGLMAAVLKTDAILVHSEQEGAATTCLASSKSRVASRDTPISIDVLDGLVKDVFVKNLYKVYHNM